VRARRGGRALVRAGPANLRKKKDVGGTRASPLHSNAFSRFGQNVALFGHPLRKLRFSAHASRFPLKLVFPPAWPSGRPPQALRLSLTYVRDSAAV
jgi:hypothetical protein